MSNTPNDNVNATGNLTNTTATRLSMLGLVVGCVIFGLGSIIVANVAVGGFAIAFWRLLVAGIIFLALCGYTKQRLPSSWRARIYALLAGAYLGFDLALWHESIYAVGPGISTLLNSLQIFFLAFMGFIWFKETQSKLQLISLIMAMMGVALIASPELIVNVHATWGFISGIVSGAMLAASMVFIRLTHEVEKTPIFAMMLLLSIGGILALLLPMLWFDAGHILPTSWQDVGLIVVYGAVMQCLAWGLIAYCIPRLSLGVTGLLLLTEPVAALLIDYFLLGKVIVLSQWAGVGLTMLAIYLGSIKADKA